MSKIQVLCATMHQKDIYCKYKEMNIKTDAIFANQSDHFSFQEMNIDNNNVKVITTKYRGVSNNRNFALLNATSDICIFADDDITYYDDYVQQVQKAYDELPDADIILFNYSKKDGYSNDIKKIHRVRFWNFMRYGAVRITAKTKSIKKNNIVFNEMFGGGCPYCSGEDNLFLKESLYKGLKIYAYPYTLVDLQESDSSWFEGHNEKYFYDHGAFLQAGFPFLKYFLAILFYIKYKKNKLDKNNISLSKMINGIRGFKKGMTFDQWNNKTSEGEKNVR